MLLHRIELEIMIKAIVEKKKIQSMVSIKKKFILYSINNTG